jgi:hypothetical protein
MQKWCTFMPHEFRTVTYRHRRMGPVSDRGWLQCLIERRPSVAPARARNNHHPDHRGAFT